MPIFIGRHFFAAILKCFTLSVLVGGACSCSKSDVETYYTWEGLGPDKWASAWYIQKVVSPKANIVVLPVGSKIDAEQFTFDFPGALYSRIEHTTTFEQLFKSSAHTDPTMSRLVKIVHDIEVNFWGETADPMSDMVETGFRVLQRNNAGRAVTTACYFAFFDKVHQAIVQSAESINPAQLQPDPECFNSQTPGTSVANPKFVPELKITDIVRSLGQGQQVAFIDVREPWEFKENHIPNALNVQLRDAEQLKAEDFTQYKYVVAYCVKDFRGFEMAKALRLQGFDNAVILNPYGIKGWINEGMPVTTAGGMDDAQAHKKLIECARDSCIASMGG